MQLPFVALFDQGNVPNSHLHAVEGEVLKYVADIAILLLQFYYCIYLIIIYFITYLLPTRAGNWRRRIRGSVSSLMFVV